MKHTKHVSKPAPLPILANSPLVCGRFVLTGKTKCVPVSSFKARFIEDIPVP